MKHSPDPLTASTDQKSPELAEGKGAVAFLTAQHRSIEALFSQFGEAGPGQVRAKLLAQLLHATQGHVAVEEGVFYPAAKSIDKSLVLKCLEEHGMIKGIIAKLHALSANDETLIAKVAVLQDSLRRHSKVEEKQFFPLVKDALDDKRMSALGALLEQAWERFNSAPLAVKLPEKRAAATKRSGAASRSAKVSPGSRLSGDRPASTRGHAGLSSQPGPAVGRIIRRPATR